MVKRLVIIAIGIVAAVVLGGLASLYFKRPAMAPPLAIKVDQTPERLERGKYLFDHLCSCKDCHSEVDETRFGFPPAPGGYAKGKTFPDTMGLPGRVVAPNLTSDPETGLGNWTDGEIIRAVREGIGKDNRVLFPFMPYPEYRHLSDDDVQAVVAYLRTIPPVRNQLPKTEISFPVNLLIKGVPKPVGKVDAPDPGNTVAYGKYLAQVSACVFCHTEMTQSGQPVEGKFMAGGHEFNIGSGVVVRSLNLTPEPTTGTGNWTEEQFVEKFYQYKEYAEKESPKLELRDNTVMPWLGLSGLKREDLSAIWAYIRTVPPVVNAVETKPSASPDKKGN